MKRRGMFLLVEADTDNASFGFDISRFFIGIRLWFVAIHLMFVPTDIWLRALNMAKDEALKQMRESSLKEHGGN
jgi:hypothetical protein